MIKWTLCELGVTLEPTKILKFCFFFLFPQKYSVFVCWQIFDGHNGISAAIFAKEQLLDNVLSAIPQDISREGWLQALPRALVAGFVKTDIEFQQGGMSMYPFYCSFILFVASYASFLCVCVCVQVLIFQFNVNCRGDFRDNCDICHNRWVDCDCCFCGGFTMHIGQPGGCGFSLDS